MRGDGFLSNLLSILMILLVIALAVLVFFNYQANSRQMAEIAAAEAAAAVTPTPEPVQTPEPTPEPERNVETVTLTFAGDVVGQAGLTTDALIASDDDSAEYDYSLQLEGVEDILSQADLTACTLVGTLTSSGSYDAYRMAPTMANALVGAGFKVVNAASDHILNFGLDGLAETVSILNSQGLQTIGAYTGELSSGLFVANVGNLKVALLSYTCGTGGNSVATSPWCLNVLTTDYMSGQETVDYDRIDRDVEAVRSAGADVVVCMIYWWDNTQYYAEPRDNQTEVVDYLTQKGVDIVIGSGVKSPQPIRVNTVERADGTKANTVVCYNLSNLLSCFNDKYTNISAIASIEVSRDLDSGDVWVSGVCYDPVFTLDTEDNGAYGGEDERFWALAAYDLVEAYENGESGAVEEAAYEAVKAGITDLQTLLGAEYDRANGGVSLAYPY